MSGPETMAQRHGRMLAELSEFGMSLARDLHDRAAEAESPEEKAALTGAFHRISRSVRQTLALEARLERDRRRAEQDAAREAEHTRRTAIQRRCDRLRAATSRLIWTEVEADEAEALIDDLDDRLEADRHADGFLDEPFEAQLARLCAELGLTAPRDAPEDPVACEPLRRSSA